MWILLQWKSMNVRLVLQVMPILLKTCVADCIMILYDPSFGDDFLTIVFEAHSTVQQSVTPKEVGPSAKKIAIDELIDTWPTWQTIHSCDDNHFTGWICYPVVSLCHI
jgi:hypothetical protein